MPLDSKVTEPGSKCEFLEDSRHTFCKMLSASQYVPVVHAGVKGLTPSLPMFSCITANIHRTCHRHLELQRPYPNSQAA